MADDIVRVKELPEEPMLESLREIGLYTVGFLKILNAEKNHVSLRGSGVCVQANGRKAILTAHHVAHELEKLDRIGLIIGRTATPHSIEPSGVAVIPLGRGTNEKRGPDLAALVLAPHIAGTLEAKKSFYNLDKRRADVLERPHDLRDGVWAAQGFVEERTTIGVEFDGTTTKYFHNFTGFGAPDEVESAGEHDYFDFPVSAEAQPSAPRAFGGMSGGGIWQVPIKREGGVLVPLRPILSGIMFYQHPTTDTQCGIRGHGRRSVYEKAHHAIANPQ